jgi:hypothetical protein
MERQKLFNMVMVSLLEEDSETPDFLELHGMGTESDQAFVVKLEEICKLKPKAQEFALKNFARDHLLLADMFDMKKKLRR